MDDLITEEPPSFSSKIKMETLLATIQLPQLVNDQGTLSVQSFAGQKYSKRLFGIHCLYLGWHLLFLWPQHTIIYTNYSNKNSRLKPWLYELTFVELLRLIFNCLPLTDEMAITKQSRFYLEHVV